MLGAIMAAPLATPLTRTSVRADFARCASTSFGNVSVVIIAVAASRNLGRRREPTGDLPEFRRPVFPAAESGRSRRSSRPARLRPSNPSLLRDLGGHPAGVLVPRAPVQALALPELTITARAVVRGSRDREIFDRRAADQIRREDSGGRRRSVSRKQGQVELRQDPI